ncbi:glycosyltransferase [Mucilaginibacter aquatilis]|uniref:Glycosyltransferase n=1 Tax=Mucilaginibacter aquatilis TaxID=1517760 RepID=A0A6I4IB51_9SPHI|nr:glycosyltransferase [Mucilaginibacter aquatilis]MVN92425.1 glycosyltransferase [Mucilaginibacter aquatilis]
MAHKQIFQADNPKRWNKFKWLSRVIIFVLLSGVVAAAITVTSKQYPSLPNLVPTQKKLTTDELNKLKRSAEYRDFKVEKERIEETRRALKRHQLRHPNNANRINVGFYLAWEPQAYFSLAENIKRLDMIVSEGFAITPGKDTITARLDTGLINLNKRYKKPVIVRLTNYINLSNTEGRFDTRDVQRIIANKKLRTAFISNIANKLSQYNLRGLDLNFDDIKNRKSADYLAFQRELYTTLHVRGFLVTQSFWPEDDEYDLQFLQKYNDYLFAMAIDQHNESSNAGDISHQHWVEEQLDAVCQKIPSNKIILTFAAGGYDWPENQYGRSIGYQQAVSTAAENKSKVVFDSESANLMYTYKGTDTLKHTVYFADAVTNFNIIRMADDWATGGVALWRLGSEDPRLWRFFAKNLSTDSLKKTGVDTRWFTNKVGLNNRIDYAGDGEVLDLVTQPDTGKINVQFNAKTFTFTNQEYLKLPTKYVIRRYGYAPGKIVLTFDDGPDPNYTPRIIDILKKEKIPGSFFVVGSMVEKNIPLLKRIFDEGYEIGNHTFFHPDISQISLQRVSFELNATRKLIESITGHSTVLFRAPFNADAEPQTIAEVIPVAKSKEENYINIGEFIDPHDWEPGVTADTIVARTIRQANNGSMILLHDAGGDSREETIKALPRIIEYFKTHTYDGVHKYEFTTIADVLNKKKEDLMPRVTNDADSGVTGRLYDMFNVGLFYTNWILLYLFLSAIFLAVGRIILIGILALRQFALNKKNPDHDVDIAALPPVSIIVPAYNEEVTAIKTIQSLLQLEYPKMEILFIDDGSKDKTYEIVNNAYQNHPAVRVLTKPNGGKASALNFGIAQAQHEFVVCIDADTLLKNDAIIHLMAYFTDAEIGAVAGTVKVGNETNIITRWQSIEYITAQNMDRRAFDLLNSITVVPGAIGAFRKEAVAKAGGFTTDTLAEDCDLTMRILKQGYIIRNAGEAIAYTEAPETIHMLLKQRFRWSYGVMQSFWKNRDALFRSRYKFFGMVGMPNILVFQIILPLFSPLADLMMIGGMFSDHPEKIFYFYLAFIVIDLLVAVIAFKMEKEDYRKLIYIIPQRFVWRQLMYYILFKSLRHALKGQHSGWGNLKRTGNVKATQPKTE